MELFEALYVERWLQAKGPSKAKARVPSMTAKALGWQIIPFDGKGKGIFKPNDLRWQMQGH
jgi:hypothetical protein